jgi:hypothetical protein
MKASNKYLLTLIISIYLIIFISILITQSNSLSGIIDYKFKQTLNFNTTHNETKQSF